jgi:toxin ParE1/3/4
MARWTPDAIDDVREAWDYIAADNEAAADRVVERLNAAAELLDEHPFIGHTGLEPATREFVVARTPYLLVYREPEILRVIHGKQDWPPKG